MSNQTYEPSTNGNTKADVNRLTAFLDTPGKPKVKVDHNTRVIRDGKHIIIPDGMPYLAAAEAVYKLAQEDEAELNRDEKFTCHPDDGRVALMRCLKRSFGQVTSSPIQTFFGPIPPSIERVPTGPNGTTEEVFSFGELSVPALPDVKIQTQGDKSGMFLHIRVKAKRKHGDAINFLFDDIREALRNDSIYKGKVIDSTFTFLDVSQSSMDNLMLPHQTMREVQSNIVTPLQHQAALATYKIPFKRGVLLEGPFGTGKTSIAYVGAKVAQENNVTFLYVRPDDNDDIPTYLRFARHYAPCVLFIEDIDQFASGERGEDLQKLLNELDGIVSKQGDASKVMVIMTTNHVEKINPALLRPGRLDAVIHVGLPDADAAGRLVRLYGNGALSNTFDAKKAGEALVGFTPAFIRECVERAKLHGLSRDGGNSLTVTAEDVVEAATSIRHHLALATPQDKTVSKNERLGAAFADVMGTSVTNIDRVVQMQALVESAHTYLRDEDATKAVKDAAK